MKSFRKTLLAFGLIFFLLISLSACKSPSEAASEKIAEKIIENATGAKIDFDGENMTLKNEEGEFSLSFDNKWPTEKLGKSIPELDGGTVTYVANSDQMCSINVDDLKASSFEEYLKKVKNAGYTQNESYFDDPDMKTFTATNADNITLRLTYYGDGTLHVTARK